MARCRDEDARSEGQSGQAAEEHSQRRPEAVEELSAAGQVVAVTECEKRMTNDGWAKTVPERALLALGVVFLGIFVAEVGFRGVSSDHALREFDADRTAAKSTAASPVPDLATEAPDFTFWSETRIR